MYHAANSRNPSRDWGVAPSSLREHRRPGLSPDENVLRAQIAQRPNIPWPRCRDELRQQRGLSVCLKPCGNRAIAKDKSPRKPEGLEADVEGLPVLPPSQPVLDRTNAMAFNQEKVQF